MIKYKISILVMIIKYEVIIYFSTFIFNYNDIAHCIKYVATVTFTEWSFLNFPFYLVLAHIDESLDCAKTFKLQLFMIKLDFLSIRSIILISK